MTGRMIALLLALGGCHADDGSCGVSVEEYCSTEAMCPLTWLDAHSPAAWGNPCQGGTDRLQLSICPNVLVARIVYVDTGRIHYFDPVDGDLYRIDAWVALPGGAPKCVAGDGPAPACEDPNVFFPCGYVP